MPPPAILGLYLSISKSTYVGIFYQCGTWTGNSVNNEPNGLHCWVPALVEILASLGQIVAQAIHLRKNFEELLEGLVAIGPV